MEIANTYYSEFIRLYKDFKEQELKGRYITYAHLEKPLDKIAAKFDSSEIGKSTLGKPIRSISLGKGKIKILAWSQMHGNESTTTKAVFDLFSACDKYGDHPFLASLLSNCTLRVIPMLNPDGAEAYTRENANMVDLNRDAFLLNEKESKLLRREFDKFQPDFCFNLHDQRTIFSAGDQAFPATLSFLTPAMDPDRNITASRERSMKVIAAMARDLKKILPHQIGRYDDAFNQNCTGDTFQSLQVPTILFEAGHYKNDYHRERSREFLAYALFSGLHAIASGEFLERNIKEYFELPENKKLFYDVILRNFKLKDRKVDIAIQYKELVDGNRVEFIPVIVFLAPEISFYGHTEIDCEISSVEIKVEGEITENVIVKRILVNDEVLPIN